MVKLYFINPHEVAEQQGIIKDLRDFGIDHTTPFLTSGWNYVIDHVFMAQRLQNVIKKDSVIMDIGCGNSPFHEYIENRYDVEIIGVDRPEGYSHQKKQKNVDHSIDFMDMDIQTKSVDVVFWLSSIEHNDIEKIKKIYKKSMRILKRGGIFLATVPIAPETAWFAPSEQTNLSTEDCQCLFGVDETIGDYEKTRDGYLNNTLYLLDKAVLRYGSIPDFVIACIDVVKK